jgi:hypothetical protein
MDKEKQAQIVHKKAIYNLTFLGFMDNQDNK